MTKKEQFCSFFRIIPFIIYIFHLGIKITMRAVFLDKKTFDPTLSLSGIEQVLTELHCFDTTPTEDIVKRCLNADIIITNKVLLSEQILKQLPQLKLICITATGFNNVDIKAAKALGIAVTNVSGYAKQSVAQYVFAQLLEYYSQTTHHNSNTEQGLWQKSDTFCYLGNTISELAGKTLGIIGYGSLGQSVATIALAFNMKVVIAERPNTTIIRDGRMAFDEVLTQSDVISFHCPQTPETTGMINSQLLKKMKTSAILMNTARGALVNNSDLLNALENEDIAYAILDVLDQEPPPADHLLLTAKLPNLKITAHIAWASIEAQQRLLELVAQNILAFSKNVRCNRVD